MKLSSFVKVGGASFVATVSTRSRVSAAGTPSLQKRAPDGGDAAATTEGPRRWGRRGCSDDVPIVEGSSAVGTPPLQQRVRRRWGGA